MDILETLQEKYVPMVENEGESVSAEIVFFFGGDQLTEETFFLSFFSFHSFIYCL